MVYSPVVRIAANIAYEAHKYDVDRAGYPYVFHPIHVAEQMDDEYSCAAALLHDVVEDTDYTLDDLESAGLPKEVVDAVGLLTHKRGVPYIDYIRELAKNDIARKVKMADIAHNTDLTRTSDVEPDGGEQRRAAKYAQAWDYLTQL